MEYCAIKKYILSLGQGDNYCEERFWDRFNKKFQMLVASMDGWQVWQKMYLFELFIPKYRQVK